MMVMKQKPTATSILEQPYMHYSAPTCISDILTLIIRIDSIPLISIRQLMMTGLDAVIMSSTVGYSGWLAFLQNSREARCSFKMCQNNAWKEKSTNVTGCCCSPSMNVVNLFRERADDDLWPAALWIIVRHQVLKDCLVLVVVTAESLHEAPQTALHGYSYRGILQTDAHSWEQTQTVNYNMHNLTEFTASLQMYELRFSVFDKEITIDWLHERKPNYLYGSV